MTYQLEELSLELTNECTLACIHCSSGSSPEKLPNELTYDEHISLITQARELGATVLSLSGGNPLLYDNLSGLIDWATKIGYERILIYTTGHSAYGPHIASCDAVHDIMLNELVTWIFSLHSTDLEVNDSIMGAYNQDVPDLLGKQITSDIIASMSWLIENNQAVEVHMVPMKPNFRNIPHMREFCAALGVNKLSLLRFVPQTRGLDNIDELGMDKAEFIEMQMLINTEKQKDSPVELRTGCPIDFRHSLGLLDEKAKPCHAADDLMLVRPTGDVHPCAAWKSLPADSNVRDHPLRYIWTNSETFEYIRRFKSAPVVPTLYDTNYEMVDGCRSCDKLHSCQTGCLAQRLHAYDGGALDTLLCEWSDPLCPRGIQPQMGGLMKDQPIQMGMSGWGIEQQGDIVKLSAMENDMSGVIIAIDEAKGESQTVAVMSDTSMKFTTFDELMDCEAAESCEECVDTPCTGCPDGDESCKC